MLVCVEIDAIGDIYYIIDTKKTDITKLHSAGYDDEDTADEYNKDEIEELLQTYKVIGLDINKRDYIDTDLMYGVDTEWYGLNLNTDNHSPYVLISNLDDMYLYDLATDQLVMQHKLLGGINVLDITLRGNLITVQYEYAGIDFILKVYYDITGTNITQRDKGILISSCDLSDNEEEEVDLSVTTEYAKGLLNELGIDAELAYKDRYFISEHTLGILFEDKRQRYIVLKDEVNIVQNTLRSTWKNIYKKES